MCTGGTEANNLAILGIAEASVARRESVVASVVEHPATARPCERLEKKGWNVARAPVDADYRVSPETFHSVPLYRIDVLRDQAFQEAPRLPGREHLVGTVGLRLPEVVSRDGAALLQGGGSGLVTR